LTPIEDSSIFSTVPATQIAISVLGDSALEKVVLGADEAKQAQMDACFQKATKALNAQPFHEVNPSSWLIERLAQPPPRISDNC
jgi:hypothetical protein